ncbi:DUF6130 family protein [Nitrospira moscoviensis]|uniref:DUF4399 domain-containing protein n=1 Tax=Nitrospira moscoviensis TaxID=42253 RepID=A0A0K2GAJ7_NITMO|nr:DUF6130 family protein [Nitrospira moscoviensis]ALA57963.1 conserved exported protein of unknown function [Nitrospira moscoviensis]
MKRIALMLAAVAMASGVVTVRAQTSTPTNEPPAKLIVEPPLPDLLAQGIVWITWRAENVHIGPVSGRDALNASPRVGHLHIHVDDLPWLWAHMSNAPIDVALLPPGPHKIRIELVNAVHQGVPNQSKTVTFTIPDGASPHQ